MSGGIVIGIHGLENKPPRRVLADGWLDALTEGLDRNGGSAPRIVFALAYWSDVLHARPVPDDEQSEPYRRAPGSGALERHDPGFVDPARAFLEKFGGRAIDKAKDLIGIGPGVERLLGIALSDLAAYYADSGVRAEMRGRLARLLEAHRRRPVLLIAHSMGSIIAYDALRAAERTGPPASLRLITIGSPLGLPLVGERVRAEWGDPVTPAGVERWTNLADPGDRVTLDASLRDEFGPNAAGVQVEDVLVVNGYVRPDGEENNHKSYGYLRAPELSDLVRDFATG